MKMRRLLLLLLSLLVGVVLIVLLARIAAVRPNAVVEQVRRVSRLSFLNIVLLNGLLILISTIKWRMVDKALRNPAQAAPAFSASFTLSSVGMALGLFLPVQLGMTIARTLGTRLNDGAIKRGTGGTFLEQGFDVLMVALLAVASCVTIALHAGLRVWTVLALIAVSLALLVIGPALRALRWFAARNSVSCTTRHGWLSRQLQRVREFPCSDLYSASLGRRLVLLSALRFGVVVLMAGQTSSAVGAPIPLWHMAAAMPFVVLAGAIAIIPGGLGVNELSAAAALNLFGTPMSIGGRWALASRVLVTAACLIVAAAAIAITGVKRVVARAGIDVEDKRSFSCSKEEELLTADVVHHLSSSSER